MLKDHLTRLEEGFKLKIVMSKNLKSFGRAEFANNVCRFLTHDALPIRAEFVSFQENSTRSLGIFYRGNVDSQC